jgi:hypothetical protein
MEATNKVDELRADIFKHYTSRCLNSEGIMKILQNMKHTLTHGLVRAWRREKMYDHISTMIKELKTEGGDSSLRSRLRQISSDLQEDFETVCTTGNPADIDSLMDDFRELHNISEEISSLKPEIYNEYILVMKNAGNCKASLPKLVPQKKGGKWTVRVESINSLTTTFGILYSSIDGLIANINSPLDTGNKKKVSSTTRDLEDDQDEAKRRQAYNLLVKENWPIKDIGPTMNMTQDEVLELLDMDEDEEEE